MEQKHVINEELYTNSLLISPNPDEESIIEFYWVKKNSMFSNSKEKRVISSTHQLYYQCTLFDYLSTIELVMTDKKGRKIIYVFGPIQLQPDLYPYLKVRQLNYSIKTIFNKKQAILTNLKINSSQTLTNLQFSIDSGINFKLKYPQANDQDDYQGLFKFEEIQSTQIDLNFSKEKRIMVEIFKKLKIYSYQGNFLKVLFKNQSQRDIFLLNLLIQVGFIFEPETKKNNPKKMVAKVSEMKTQSSHFKEISSSLQNAQIPKDNTFHEACQVLCSRNQMKELMERVQTPISKIQTKEGGIDHNVSDSIDFEFCELKKKAFVESPKATTPLNYTKDFSYRNKDFEFYEDSKRRNSHLNQKDFSEILQNEEKKMKQFFREKKKLEDNNRVLAEQNKELKIKMNEIIRKKKEDELKEKQLPLFIKQMHIEKEIKKKINEEMLLEQNQRKSYGRQTSTSKSRERPVISRRISNANNNSNQRYSSNTPIKTTVSREKQPETKGFPVHPQPASSLMGIRSFPFLPNFVGSPKGVPQRNSVNQSKKMVKINYGKPVKKIE